MSQRPTEQGGHQPLAHPTLRPQQWWAVHVSSASAHPDSALPQSQSSSCPRASCTSWVLPTLRALPLAKRLGELAPPRQPSSRGGKERCTSVHPPVLQTDNNGGPYIIGIEPWLPTRACPAFLTFRPSLSYFPCSLLLSVIISTKTTCTQVTVLGCVSGASQMTKHPRIPFSREGCE